MAKKATKRELVRKSRASVRDVLLAKASKRSYIRPLAYKAGETKNEE